MIMSNSITASATPSILAFPPADSGPWSLIVAIEAHRGLMSATDLAVIPWQIKVHRISDGEA